MDRASRTCLFSLIVTLTGLHGTGTLLAQNIDRAAAQGGSPLETRHSLLERQRAAKRDSLAAPAQTSLEKALLFIEQNRIIDRLRFGYHHFFPSFGGLTTGSGLALGVRYSNPVLPGRGEVRLSATRSTRGYQQYTAGLSSAPFPSIPIVLSADARYRNFPQEDFYGIGPGSRKADESDYRLEDTKAGAGITLAFGSRLRVGGEAAYLNSRTAAGTSDDIPSLQERFTPQEAPGFSETIESRVAAAVLDLDLRDSPSNPRSGIGFFLEHAIYDDPDRDRFSFRRTSAEFQGYLPFLHKHRVFALRTSAVSAQGREGGEVPFYEMPYVGGGQSLRGFREYRFRGKRALLANLEYRFEAFIGCDMALFTEAGQVASAWDDLTLSGFEYSYGSGFRFNTYKNVFLRLDVGHGKEGTRFLFKFENAF